MYYTILFFYVSHFDPWPDKNGLRGIDRNDIRFSTRAIHENEKECCILIIYEILLIY